MPGYALLVSSCRRRDEICCSYFWSLLCCMLHVLKALSEPEWTLLLLSSATIRVQSMLAQPKCLPLDHECVECQSTKENQKLICHPYVRTSKATVTRSYTSRSFPLSFDPDPSVSILKRGVPAGLASLPSPWKNSQENLSALPASFQTTTSSPE